MPVVLAHERQKNIELTKASPDYNLADDASELTILCKFLRFIRSDRSRLVRSPIPLGFPHLD